jgi:hypothetical protein
MEWSLMMKRWTLTAAALLIAATTAAPALSDDDRAPTPEERERIEAALRGAGYTSWEEIDMDDGQWDVDDARRGDDPHEYDVHLAPDSYEVVSETRDD